jgi:ribonuclease HI
MNSNHAGVVRRLALLSEENSQRCEEERVLNQKSRPKYSPSTMSVMYNSPFQGIFPISSPRMTLNFGSVFKQDSLIGGCAWWISQERKSIVCNGSLPVIQTFPSLIRLEYEALLNGLKDAFQRNFRNIIIRGSSQFVIYHLQSGTISPVFQTVYVLIKDLYAAIKRLLPEFTYELQLVSKKKNYFSHKLAENIIIDYHNKRDMKIAKQQIRYSTIDRFQSSSFNNHYSLKGHNVITESYGFDFY